MEQLIELFRRLLALTDTSYVRYLHDHIDWSSRMIGIVGPRGVGKPSIAYLTWPRIFTKMGGSICLLMKCINIRIGPKN